MPDFLRVPAVPEPLVLSMADPSMLAETPERLLGLAAHLLLSGDTARGGEYLDLLEQTGRIPPGSELAARLAAFQSFRYGVAGQLETAVQKALAARAAQDLTHLTDEWNVAVPLILARMYTCLGDFPAAEREAAAALAAPDVAESVKLVMVPGKRALALFEAGYLAQAADLAGAADADAQPLGFSWHFFAVDHLRALSGLALERRDLDAAEHLTERLLSITEQRRPLLEFLALLAQTDEQETLLRLSLGDTQSPAELASNLPAARRGLLLARGALAAGANHGVQQHLRTAALGDLTPRQALVRQILLAAAAIERAAQPDSAPSSRVLAEPLTAAEERVLQLLPTSTYLQIADTLYISRNTVKTHLRSIYQKLAVASRSEALERAVDLRLL